MNKAAVKSMITLMFYLVILIAIWAVIGIFVFPDEAAENRYADYVQENAPMLIQVAENAMDESMWEGITEVREIKDLLKEGKVQAVHAYDAGVSFVLPSDVADGGLYICYDPSGAAFLDAKAHLAPVAQNPDAWTLIESTDRLQRWQGGLMDKGYYNVTKLAESFYLVDYCLPT